jgi:hypothetical protein
MPYGKPDYDPITDAHRCEECGKWYRGLVRHITRRHGMTSRDYKAKWGINMKESLMGEELRGRLSKAAFRTGVYKNVAEGGKTYWFKKGESTFQKYRRSEQTKKRLRLLRKATKKR